MITKFMVTIGPIHEKDLSDVCKQLESYPDIRVSTYSSQKPKRVVRTTGIKRKTMTPEAEATMQKLVGNGQSIKEVAALTGYSEITVLRHTRDIVMEQQEIKL